MTSRMLTPLAALLVLGALATPTLARPAGDPSALVVKASKAISDLAADATTHDRMVTEIRAQLAALIDYDAVSARTLKGTWDTLSVEDRARFRDTFKALITHTYAKRFKVGSRFDVSLRGETEWLGEARDQAVVKTTIKGAKAAADVDYLFLASATGGQPAWRAADIIIDEVSMARNWRTQFKKIIARDGFEALLAKISKKVSREQGRER